jgi:hypothetical protein
MLFSGNELVSSPQNAPMARQDFFTIIAAPPERLKGFTLAHCRRKANSLAWGIVPNQSDAHAPKIGLHMRR